MMPKQATAAMPAIEAHVGKGLLAFPVVLVAGTKKPKYPGWQSKVWDLGVLEAELCQPNVIGYGLTLPKADPRRLVDLDLDDGKEGLQPGQEPWQDRLAAVEAEHGPLPATKTTLTPSGGQHRWFLWPEEAPMPGGAWHGFTVRTLHGARNFVVGPGSVSPAGPYVNAAIGTPVATMPAELAMTGTKTRPSATLDALTIRAPYTLPETIDHGECHLEVCRYTLSLWSSRRSLSEMWTLTLHELGPKLATPHTEEHLREHFDRAVEPLPTKFPRDDHAYLIHSAGPPVEPAESNGSEPDKHSAGSAPSIAAERIRARFATAAVLVEDVPERPPFLAEPYLVAGATTECVGKVKVGKTDLTLALASALIAGGTFLGRAIERTPVVYLTEQPASSLRASLTRAGLAESTELLLLSWPSVAGERWPAVVQAAILEAQRIGARVLFVDTLSRFAGIRGDGENNAGEADAAMAPLQVAAAEGLAVWVNRHERKSGGDVGDSGRGSSAFSGAVDIALALRRGQGNTRPTVRVLHALSRFDETPDTLVIERTDDGYVALGDETAVASAEARKAALAELPAEPDGAVRFDELYEALKVRGHGRTTLQQVIADLVGEGAVFRIGEGKRGKPYLYHLPAIHSAAPIGGEAAERNGDASNAVDLTPYARAIFGADLLS